jgi:beta-fructofuranosidase
MNTHRQKLEAANLILSQAAERLGYDPHKPAFHAHAPVNWMNDPNGLVYFQDEYHLFYQHNPFVPKQWESGTIHWGHMKSKDLVHWEHLPIALAPSEDYDRDGCFSGGAAVHEGKLYLFYTSNIFTVPPGLPDDLLQQQCVAVSEDGIHFEKSVANPIIKHPPAGIGQVNHFRDPNVFFRQGAWYLLVGNRLGQNGKILMYRSNDLIHWEYVKVFGESNGDMGYMWECPDFFTSDGKDILAFSPQGIGWPDQPNIAGYYIGRLDDQSLDFSHGEFHKLDFGFDFYAPQSFEDGKGRRILFGWMRMPKNADKQWAGSMTLPRELRVAGDRLTVHPVKELQLLRQNPVSLSEVRIEQDAKTTLPGIKGTCLELICTFDLTDTDAAEFGLELRTSPAGLQKTVITYSTASHTITLDRNQSGELVSGTRICDLQRHANELELHIFLDRCMMEMFINKGDFVMSGYMFPNPDNEDIVFFSRGGTTKLTSIECWNLKL